MATARIVVEQGAVTTLDEKAVRAELAERLTEIRAWQDKLNGVNEVFTEPFRRMYDRAMATPSDIHRFSGHTHG